MLNENIFRNTHYQILNKIKQSFAPLYVPEVFTAKKIRVSYYIYKKTKRSFDTGNVAFAIDKFFMDWLQNNGFIENDAFNYVSYGSIDGCNQHYNDRAECTIEVIE